MSTVGTICDTNGINAVPPPGLINAAEAVVASARDEAAESEKSGEADA